MNLLKRISAVLISLSCILFIFTSCKKENSPVVSGAERTLSIPVYAKDPAIDTSLFERYKDRDPDGGNASAFAAKRIIKRENSPLAGKTIYWLGSSVTYGSSSKGETMVEMLSELTGCIGVKEAVSGTTLFTDNGELGKMSYVNRLKNSDKFDTDKKIDAFICQISTNDARPECEEYFGEITPDDQTEQNSFDIGTSLGGVEYIISYVTETWHCPVYFYAGAKFDNPPYSDLYDRLVNSVHRAAEKWNAKEGYTVGVIDMFHDEAFNGLVDEESRAFMMFDGVHPKKAGYALWWTPYFEEYLLKNLK